VDSAGKMKDKKREQCKGGTRSGGAVGKGSGVGGKVSRGNDRAGIGGCPRKWGIGGWKNRRNKGG